MPFPWRARALLLSSCAALSLCGCLPSRISGTPRFDSCSIAVYDATGTGSAAGIGPQLAEVAAFTGLRFHWVRSAADARFGLTIARIEPGVPATVQGSYQETLHGAGPRGEHVVVGSVLRLRPTASAAIRRHELGHLFNLAHNGGSALMRAAPAPTATYSASERAAMRAMAARSACGTAARLSRSGR